MGEIERERRRNFVGKEAVPSGRRVEGSGGGVDGGCSGRFYSLVVRFFFGIFFLQIIRLFICWSHERGGADRLAGPVVDRNLGRRSGRVGDLRVASEEAAGNERRRLGMG